MPKEVVLVQAPLGFRCNASYILNIGGPLTHVGDVTLSPVATRMRITRKI